MALGAKDILGDPLQLLPLFARLTRESIIHLPMFQNYFKVALRNIVKHKFYSALNVAGLALGLTSSVLVGLYIHDELTFDQFHVDVENIYSVALHGKIGGQEIYTSTTCPPLAEEMVHSIPGVEQAVRVRSHNNVVMRYEDKVFTEPEVLRVDSNFFEFFSFKLIEGDANSVLREPRSMVLTSESARRYFGSESAMGKIITFGNDNESYKVTGIVEPAPNNSQIRFEVIVTSRGDEFMESNGWTSNSLATFVRKTPATAVSGIDAKLKDFVKEYVGAELQAGMGVSLEEFEKNGGVYAYYVYPMTDQHLFQSELQDGLVPKSDIRNVYVLGGIGGLILLIACINFMNLSTARSASRAKEVGLRKTLGSARSKLIYQFLSESFLYTFVGLLVAVVAIYLLIPSFNLLSAKTISFSSLLNPVILSLIGGVFLFVALLAGCYPAFYLTSFKPVDVLKGKVRAGMKSKGIRSVLVVVQFSISIILIISTMIVYNQLSYLQEKNIGLDKQNVLILRNTRRLQGNMESFKEKVKELQGVEAASFTNNVFPGVNNTTVFRAAGSTQDRIMGTYVADYDHLDVLKMELAQGRFFEREFTTDTMACVLNEAAVRELGWTDPLNEKLTSIDGPTHLDMPVVGIVKDFNFESFKSKVRPMVIQLRPTANALLIRYSGGASELVKKVEAEWKEISPNDPFEYAFLDQNFDELFREEQRLGQLASVFTGIAIFVACLGLMGLASFTAEQRTKEIGIRKVMGASAASVSAMLSKEFMILVGISFVIAAGFSWYLMSNWLNGFAYRIDLGPMVFIAGGAIAAAVAWLTVSYHFIRAARSNPSDALRYE